MLPVIMTRIVGDEDALVAALKRGDEPAFAELVDRHTPALLRVAQGYVPTREIAEDVVQETWIALLKGIGAFEGRSSLRTWLFAILINIAKPGVSGGGQAGGELMDIANAVIASLILMKQLPKGISKSSLHVNIRSDGSYRVFLDDVEPKASKTFNQAMKEVLAPINIQPYLVPKYEFPISTKATEPETRLFFKKYMAGRAEPRIAGYHAVPALLARSD